MRKNITGFSLIELLIVISIIGVLVTVSIFGLQGAREVARDERRQSDLELIRSGLELYRADCGLYPQFVPNGGNSLTGNPAQCAGNVYINEVPTDPQGSPAIYRYTRGGGNQSYELCTRLEDDSLPTISCGGNCGSGPCNYKVTNP